ncbi:MAG TPA: PaaI family thioesterase [Solirubrobacterales bacterium]|nr:PaaI family thioesterase [Solirubrobacterales bacterium]
MTDSGNKITPEAFKKVLSEIGRSYPSEMGIEPLEITDEYSLGRIVVDDRHLHPGGLVHGGAWCGLGDTVAAWQTFRHIPEGHNFTTIEMKLNAFAAAGPGDEILARAETLHGGRSTHVIEVRMSRDERLLANLVVTQFVIAPG